jgi:hypothetical protein
MTLGLTVCRALATSILPWAQDTRVCAGRVRAPGGFGWHKTVCRKVSIENPEGLSQKLCLTPF